MKQAEATKNNFSTYLGYSSFDSLFQCFFIFKWKYFSRPLNQLRFKGKFFEEISEYVGM